MLFQRLAYCRQIVKGHGQRMPGQVCRHPRAIRDAKRHGPGAGLHQQAIGVTMIASGKFENHVTTCVASRQTNR